MILYVILLYLMHPYPKNDCEIIIRSFVTTAQGSHLQNNFKTYYCSYFDEVPYPKSDHDALRQPFVFNAPLPVEWL